MSNEKKPAIIDSYALRFPKKTRDGRAIISTPRLDPFYEDQPPIEFIEDLKKPVHEAAPFGFDKCGKPAEGQVSCKGIYVKERYPESEGLLETAYRDFERFISLCEIGGDSYPVCFKKGEVLGFESYRIDPKEDGCVVTAGDTEGIRRAIIYLEGELTKNEAPVFDAKPIERRAYIKTRITRGFFSPTNRAPKFGDELLDDIEYYPDEYLNRLVHSGTNGLWIYTSLRALVKTDYFNDDPEPIKKRIEKLKRVVSKCKRYGVKVYVFAIEPLGLMDEDHATHPDFAGAEKRFHYHPICVRSESARNYIIEATEKLFSSVPDLAGFIDITAGERPTNCASGGNYRTCPRCRNYSRGENLALACDVLKEGIRRAGTGAQFISWTYGHRYWDDSDIDEYIKDLPSDIVVMQNFEDRGYNTQLGKPRIAYDYWLSYPGPSDLYNATADMTRRYGKELYAKMQVVTSHEIATVPYIPAPGLVFRKYSAARALGTTGVMECWYFGNYPSIMSRASGELSFRDDMQDKKAFLLDFAARNYGKTMAPSIVDAWLEFEESYFHYPTNIMYSYYGPMHDGVAWELALLPKNLSLPRSWMLLDKPNGDRIGESFYRGHNIDEIIELADIMKSHWEKGLKSLPSDAGEMLTVAESIGLLYASGRNIMQFYKLRGDLGRERGDLKAILAEMKAIVIEEKAHSARMAELCEIDKRLGYHSEAEGFKFFPKKLRSRIDALDKLLEEEFPQVEARINEGKHPLGYYFAEGEDAYVIGSGKTEPVGESGSFTASIEDGKLRLDITSKENVVIRLYYEFEPGFPDPGIMFGSDNLSNHDELANSLVGSLIFHPSAASHEGVVGEVEKEELKKYSYSKTAEGGTVTHTVIREIPKNMWDGKGAIKINLCIDGECWRESDNPVYSLGKEEQSPDEFGFLILGDGEGKF